MFPFLPFPPLFFPSGFFIGILVGWLLRRESERSGGDRSAAAPPPAPS